MEQQSTDHPIPAVFIEGEEEEEPEEPTAPVRPLVLELRRAEIETMEAHVATRTGEVLLEFTTVDDLVAFLSIIGEFEDSRGGMTDRIMSFWFGGQVENHWHYHFEPWAFPNPTARCIVSVFVTFPLFDLDELIERMRLRNDEVGAELPVGRCYYGE